MRVVAIVGSSRRGNSYAMVESACLAISGECDIEILHIKDMTVKFCDGCLSCDASGACHIDDSMTTAISSVLDADGLIFATPARWSLLSGELKAFIDRLNPLAAGEKLKGKKAIIFAVGQSPCDQGDSVELACGSLVAFCENAGVEVLSKVLAFGCLEANDLMEKFPEVLAECKRAALVLIRSLNS